MDIELTPLQEKWLMQHGGRGSANLEIDNDGRLFVLMGNPVALNGMEKVYLPPWLQNQKAEYEQQTDSVSPTDENERVRAIYGALPPV